ncbi:hypothetical protein F4779DRAFT_9769 [Xylariaceae sp. FL0662B]|nr:hypothetical protein F4779DRAFT_9769 [Xylariaceae sp. FL0662B]
MVSAASMLNGSKPLAGMGECVCCWLHCVDQTWPQQPCHVVSVQMSTRLVNDIRFCRHLKILYKNHESQKDVSYRDLFYVTFRVTFRNENLLEYPRYSRLTPPLSPKPDIMFQPPLTSGKWPLGMVDTDERCVSSTSGYDQGSLPVLSPPLTSAKSPQRPTMEISWASLRAASHSALSSAA